MRWTRPTRSAWRSARSRASAPPSVTWPVSRQIGHVGARRGSVRARRRSRRASRRAGGRTWRRPWSDGDRRRPRRRRRPCGPTASSDSAGRDQSAGSLTSAVTKCSAPIAWSRAAISLAVRDRLVASRRVVADERHEGADGAQPVCVEDGPQLVGVGRQPADGAELRRRQAELAHLGRARGRPAAAAPSRAPRRRPTRSARRRPGRSAPRAASCRCPPRSPCHTHGRGPLPLERSNSYAPPVTLSRVATRRVPRARRLRRGRVQPTRPAAVVTIAATGCRPTPTSAMGVVVGDELVATVAHAVAGEDEIVVRDHAGGARRGTVVAIDTVLDAAVLRVAGLDAGPVAGDRTRRARRSRCSATTTAPSSPRRRA